MTEAQALAALEESLHIDAGSLTGDEVLKDLEGWDSMTVVELIAIVDEQHGVTLDIQSLGRCVTSGDVARVVLDAVPS